MFVELLNVVEGLRFLHVRDGSDLVRVGFDSFVGDHKAQELTRADSEDTFGWVQLHVVVPHYFE